MKPFSSLIVALVLCMAPCFYVCPFDGTEPGSCRPLPIGREPRMGVEKENPLWSANRPRSLVLLAEEAQRPDRVYCASFCYLCSTYMTQDICRGMCVGLRLPGCTSISMG